MQSKHAKLLTLLFTIVILISIIYLENTSSLFNNDSNSKENILAQSNNPTNITLPNFRYNLITHNNLSDKSYNFYNILSEKTIIHFWATWCHSCSTEFTHIINFAKNNPDITILTISIDDNLESLNNFINKLQDDNKSINISKLNNLLFSWDDDKSISMKIFNTHMVPENHIVNNQHQIIGRSVGQIDWT